MRKKQDSNEVRELRCAIYARKSLEREMTVPYGSLDAQADICREYIERHAAMGWRHVLSYSDFGLSGSNTERPELQRLLSDARAGLFDCVVVYKIDRLARNMRDFLNMLSELSEHGVELASVTESFDSTTPMGQLTMNMMGLLAEYERSMLQQRCREWAHGAQLRGLYLGPGAPFGYRKVRHRLVPNSELRPWVERVFRRYVAGDSLQSLADMLNEHGLQHALAGRGKFGSWCREHVRYLLRNPVYAGCIRCGEELVEGAHEALVSRELWAAAQRRREEEWSKMHRRLERREPRLPFPLQGLLVCGLCGSRMVPVQNRSKRSVLRYYACGRRLRRGRTACECPRLRADCVERCVQQLTDALPPVQRARLTPPGEPIGACGPADEELWRALFDSLVFYGDSGRLVLRLRHVKGAAWELPLPIDDNRCAATVVLKGYPRGKALNGRRTGHIPTQAALCMANALRLEQMLMDGSFCTPAAMARALGLSTSLLYRRLSLLNLPPTEIERLLFEVE